MQDDYVCLECPLPDCNERDPRCLRRDKLEASYGTVPLGDAGHRRGRCPTIYEIEAAFRRYGVCRGAIFLGIRQSRFRLALVNIGLVPPEPRCIKTVRRKRA